jgi:hypothetical protein
MLIVFRICCITISDSQRRLKRSGRSIRSPRCPRAPRSPCVRRRAAGPATPGVFCGAVRPRGDMITRSGNSGG